MPLLTLIDATVEDGDRLATIRVAAMRESLLAVGRFDPDRARRRLLDGFRPQDTRIVMWQEAAAGFFTLTRQRDHLGLDHLYLLPDHQGKGLGRAVLDLLKATAQQLDLPIRLIALRGSPANGFYLHNGFCPAGESDFDIRYHWTPDHAE